MSLIIKDPDGTRHNPLYEGGKKELNDKSNEDKVTEAAANTFKKPGLIRRAAKIFSVSLRKKREKKIEPFQPLEVKRGSKRNSQDSFGSDYEAEGQRELKKSRSSYEDDLEPESSERASGEWESKFKNFIENREEQLSSEGSNPPSDDEGEERIGLRKSSRIEGNGPYSLATDDSQATYYYQEVNQSLFSLNKEQKREYIKTFFCNLKGADEIPAYTSPSFSQAAIHQKENRNKDVLPYDNNIYAPNTYEGVKLKEYYLNASKIDVKFDEYIATQAPLETTLCEFWTAVIAGGSNKIVDLVMSAEKKNGVSHLKAHDYWSSSQPFAIPDLGTIQLHSKEEIAQANEEKIVKRVFHFTPIKGGPAKEIIHYHYENWPDHGVANLQLFSRLIQSVDEDPKTTGPIVTHCSAGLGRSGTFIALHHLDKELKKGYVSEENLIQKVKDLIEIMREQRARMVQSSEQLEMIFDVMEAWMKQKVKTV